MLIKFHRILAPVTGPALALVQVSMAYCPNLYQPSNAWSAAGIRAGSRRLTLYGGYNVPLGVNPFNSGLEIVDCGDIPVT